MNRTLVSLIAGLLFVGSAAAGGESEKRPTVEKAAAPAARGETVDRAELERRFTESLTGVVLSGTWQMKTEAGHPAGKTPLTEPRPDKYTIKEVQKLHDDFWMISARIEYGDKDVTLPIAVRVVWAGDTPVITIDDLAMPMLGKYSARVMVYGGYYSGTWFGDCYGGILSGQIVKEGTEKKGEKDG